MSHGHMTAYRRTHKNTECIPLWSANTMLFYIVFALRIKCNTKLRFSAPPKKPAKSARQPLSASQIRCPFGSKSAIKANTGRYERRKTLMPTKSSRHKCTMHTAYGHIRAKCTLHTHIHTHFGPAVSCCALKG